MVRLCMCMWVKTTIFPSYKNSADLNLPIQHSFAYNLTDTRIPCMYNCIDLIPPVILYYNGKDRLDWCIMKQTTTKLPHECIIMVHLLMSLPPGWPTGLSRTSRMSDSWGRDGRSGDCSHRSHTGWRMAAWWRERGGDRQRQTHRHSCPIYVR